MKKVIADAALSSAIGTDSAGTAAYHVGDRPDARSQRHAARRGVTLPGRSRQFQKSDFANFDYVLAMDEENLRNLSKLGGKQEHLSLLLDYADALPVGSSVPDPYYGGDAGFEEVLDLCQQGCEGLLAAIRREHSL